MNDKLSFVPTSSGGLRPEGDIASASRRALLQARVDVIRWLSAMSDKAAAGKLTDADRANLDAVRQHAAVVSSTLAEREAANEAEREQARQVGSGLDADALASQRAAGAIGLPGAPRPTTANGGIVGGRYRQWFPQAAASMDGWRDGQEFFSCVLGQRFDSRLRAETHHGNTGSSGGFVIPSQLSSTVWDSVIEDSVVLSRATVHPVTVGREAIVPLWDTSDRGDGAIAGVSLNWETEAPASDSAVQVAKLKQMIMRVRRAAIYAEVSNELSEDAPDFMSQVSSVVRRALSYGIDMSLLWGTGAPDAQGVFSSGALITVTRAGAGSIDYSDCTGMFSRLSPASVNSAIWIAHASALPKLLTLGIAIGTAGSAVPVISGASGRMELLGRPLLVSEKAKPLGTTGDLSLVDLSQYHVALKGDITVDVSQHVGWRRNVSTLRCQVRIDGQSGLSSPITPPHSGDTVSPFVTLS
ncbi:MAG: phage major capsid protein [Acidobacteria bacterium]|nr:phage major capsid protein [Acidobacteriota bacterium]